MSATSVTPDELERLGHEIGVRICKEQNDMLENVRGLVRRGNPNLLIGAYLAGIAKALREDEPTFPLDAYIDQWVKSVPIPPVPGPHAISRDEILREVHRRLDPPGASLS